MSIAILSAAVALEASASAAALAETSNSQTWRQIRELSTVPALSAQIVPSRPQIGVEQVVSVFLDVEVMLDDATVQVDAPEGFEFGSECELLPLEETELYRDEGGGMYAQVERLPRVIGACQGEEFVSSSGNYRRATIRLGRPLNIGKRYGFGLRVTNPSTFTSLSVQDDWSTRILDSEQNIIQASDGLVARISDAMIMANESSTRTWGLYAEVIQWGETRDILYSDGEVITEVQEQPKSRFYLHLQPFELALRTTYVTVSSLKVPHDMTTTLRMTLPLGFAFETDELRTGDYWKRMPPGVSVEFPGEFPDVKDGVYALWSTPMDFTAIDERGLRAKYGFQIGLRLPWWPRTNNKFMLEFGFMDEAVENGKRPLAMILDGPSNIQVVRGVRVDYLSGLQLFSGTIRLEVTTGSLLLPGQGLLVQAGQGSQSLTCECPTAEELYDGMTCLVSRGALDNFLIFQFVLQRDATMIAGKYVFPLQCSNPEEFVDVMEWSFATYSDFGTGEGSVLPVSVVDAEYIAPGISIKPPLAAFSLWPGSAASGFDPRPLRRSGTLLSFKLNHFDDSVLSGNVSTTFARIRAPTGTLFTIDCLDDVVVAADQVWGDGAEAPIAFDELPSVFLCEGRDHLAYITWDEAVTTNKTYVLRVMAVNPEVEPVDNVWTLEVGGQASSREFAPPVQRFGDMSASIAVPAVRLPDSSVSGSGANRLRLVFTPTVDAKSLRVEAALGYTFGFASTGSGSCLTARITGRFSATGSTQGGQLVVVPRLIRCTAALSAIDLVLDIVIGYVFTMDLDILTPTSSAAAAEALEAGEVFRLLSFVDEDGIQPGDEGSASPPALFDGVDQFTLRRLEGGDASGDTVRVEVSLAFNLNLTNERLELLFPPNFGFPGMDDTNAVSVCPTDWTRPALGPPGSCMCAFRKERGRDIKRCSIIFEVNAAPADAGEASMSRLDVPWPLGELLVFSIEVVNPGAVPSMYDNMFISSLVVDDVSGPLAVGHQRGWTVQPQLQDPRLTFASGSPMRAGVTNARLFLDFVPANDATIIRLIGQSLDGWNFLSSEVCGFPGVDCIAAASDVKENIMQTPAVEVISGERLNLEIRNAKLAEAGGLARFALQTLQVDQSGTLKVVDEGETSLLMPAEIRVNDAKLRTVTGGVLDPDDALWSQLPPRWGDENAAIVWRFSLSLAAEPGDFISLRVVDDQPIALRTDHIAIEQVEEDGSFEEIRVIEELANASEVRLRLEEALTAEHEYRAYISVTLEGAGGSGQEPLQNGAFLNMSVCRGTRAYPFATNDAVVPVGGLEQDRWFVADTFDFEILDIRTAPLTQIQLVGKLPQPAGYSSVDLIVPFGATILDPCSPSTCTQVEQDTFGTGQYSAVGLEFGEIKLLITLPVWWEQGRNQWVALARGPNNSAVAAPAWHWADNLELRLMPATVSYPAVAGSKNATLIVSFEIGRAAAAVLFEAAACSVEVVPPLGYSVLCGSINETMFNVLTAPDGAESVCDQRAGGKVVVSMTRVRFSSARDVVFAFGLDLPEETPDDHFFQVTILSSTGFTADSNTQVLGMTIPAQKLESVITFKVGGFESGAWFRSWATVASSTGALGKGLADALEVPSTSLMVTEVTAQLLEDRRLGAGHDRRAQETTLSGELRVAFVADVKLDPTSSRRFSAIEDRLLDVGFADEAIQRMTWALTDAGLTMLTLSDVVVSTPQLLVPPRVMEPSMLWSSERADTIAKVTLTVNFADPTTQVAALLFVLPELFMHEVHKLADFRSPLNLNVAEEEGSWIDTRNTSMLRIFLSDGAEIAAGRYTFAFPVYIPFEVPIYNVWHVCLCSTRSCDSNRHPSVLTAFSLPGIVGKTEVKKSIAVSEASTLRRPFFFVTLSLGAALAAVIRQPFLV